jgi:hypothetical protein
MPMLVQRRGRDTAPNTFATSAPEMIGCLEQLVSFSRTTPSVAPLNPSFQATKNTLCLCLLLWYVISVLCSHILVFWIVAAGSVISRFEGLWKSCCLKLHCGSQKPHNIQMYSLVAVSKINQLLSEESCFKYSSFREGFVLCLPSSCSNIMWIEAIKTFSTTLFT